MLEKILTTFNSFFQRNTEAKIVGDRLEITIGSQTLIIIVARGNRRSIYGFVIVPLRYA